MLLGKRKYLISGLIIAIAFGYLGYTSLQGSTTYYQVAELMAEGSSVYGENIRVNGEYDPESVITESGGLILRFTMIEGSQSLPVVHRGAIPDSFYSTNRVVTEGYLDADGIFQSKAILTKCPSKYQSEQ